MAGDDIDLIDFDLSGQRDFGSLGGQTLAQLPGHDLHIRRVQAQFLGDLPVGQIQPHKVQAQNPDPERLVMAGKNGTGQVIEASAAATAEMALAVRLGIIMAIADHVGAATVRAEDRLRPAVPAHQLVTFCVIEQRRKIDQIGHGPPSKQPR